MKKRTPRWIPENLWRASLWRPSADHRTSGVAPGHVECGEALWGRALEKEVHYFSFHLAYTDTYLTIFCGPQSQCRLCKVKSWISDMKVGSGQWETPPKINIFSFLSLYLLSMFRQGVWKTSSRLVHRRAHHSH